MDVHRSRSGLTWGALVACLLGSICGCQSTSRFGSTMERAGNPLAAQTAKRDPKTLPLSQGMEITWNVKLKSDHPAVVTTGKSIIGPDGAIELGPYGTCKIAGLNINRAAQAVEKHLGAYLTDPAVRLSTVLPESAVEFAWRAAAAPGALVQVGGPGAPKSAWEKIPVHAGGIQVTEPKDENRPAAPDVQVPAVPLPGEAAQPVGHRSRHGQHGGPGVGYPAPDAPAELNLVSLPSYVIGPPDVLQIDTTKGLVTQAVKGPHLVRPDGTVGIGIYGSTRVAGLTLEQAKEEIAKTIHSRLDPKTVKLSDVFENLSVDVIAYNSKVYYVITDGAGFGEQVVRVPITGNETVLDAISEIKGLPPVASKKHIWVARRNPGMGGPETILPVDWIGITQRGSAATNYQVMPGDRIYVRADGCARADNFLAKVLSPVERILGVTLLGSQTVNSIKSGQVGGR